MDPGLILVQGALKTLQLMSKRDNIDIDMFSYSDRSGILGSTGKQNTTYAGARGHEN